MIVNIYQSVQRGQLIKHGMLTNTCLNRNNVADKPTGKVKALSKVYLLIAYSIAHAFDDTLSPKVDDDVEITYQDNGKGIGSTVAKDILEPFIPQRRIMKILEPD